MARIWQWLRTVGVEAKTATGAPKPVAPASARAAQQLPKRAEFPQEAGAFAVGAIEGEPVSLAPVFGERLTACGSVIGSTRFFRQ